MQHKQEVMAYSWNFVEIFSHDNVTYENEYDDDFRNFECEKMRHKKEI